MKFVTTLAACVAAVCLLAAPAFAAAPATPAAIYQTQLQPLDGKLESLDRYRGHALVVNFWAPWCGPCRTEVPEFVALQEKYRGSAQFVGVALDEAPAVRAFAKDYGMNYPLYLAGMGGIATMLREGDTRGALPFTVAYDGSGRKVGSITGLASADGLEALLAVAIGSGAVNR
ncbi:TlpA family protein disulfide reductase [Paraburkholderia sp. LEh10]|uniref:TlpA family protein disulfide reductase n=1 Tax=Paraburkholderia sp. LEh10 TaxID=2821353 RepID=UPI001AEB3BFF|nr:TlpA disulfide reductase family protein [Paraburkholderia sp. LEh10]MBP0590126.1 TlpA family protein disulfide reductase [Paraburkholderia sp. LEh10]